MGGSDESEHPAGPAGEAIARRWLQVSPVVSELGIRVVRLEPDLAELELPFARRNTTLADVVHGGVVATLADTAAAAAAWMTDRVPEVDRGATVSMTTHFLRPARALDLTALATIVHRGLSLCHCQVRVVSGADLIALAVVTYKLG